MLLRRQECECWLRRILIGGVVLSDAQGTRICTFGFSLVDR